MADPVTLAVVEFIRTLCLTIAAGAMLGWVIWWWKQHGPDKENR